MARINQSNASFPSIRIVFTSKKAVECYNSIINELNSLIVYTKSKYNSFREERNNCGF